MKISIDPQVFVLAPQFVRFVLVATNLQNHEENTPLLALLRETERKVRENDAFAELKDHPRLASWRTLFEGFGVNPNRCPPSVFNLIKRVRSGKDLPFVNSLVTVFNILSLEYCFPAGGDDLTTVAGDIVLTKAKGCEHYIPLGSVDPDKNENPNEGEIILLDTGSNTVLCRAWCWKNGDTTKVMPTSKHVAVNLDILPPMVREEGQFIAEKAKMLLEEHCQATVAVHTLCAEIPSIEVII